MILYHGSKKGINGEINCYSSRKECDFGIGFYTGDKPDQPKGLIAGWPKGMYCELECNLDGLKIKRFEDNYTEQIDWALFIAFNRMPERFGGYDILCRRYQRYNDAYDVIVGLIANDKMYQLLEKFYDGTLCDKALLEGLQRVKLGNQYVFKTMEACSEKHIKMISGRQLSVEEIKLIKVQNENKKSQMDGLLNQLLTRYRRAQDIRFFDEILEEWNR